MADLKVQKQAFIDYLVSEKGIPEKDIDLTGDNTLEFEEAAAFALKSDDWECYLPGLDSIGLKHPLDPRKYAPKIKERIAELAGDAVSATEESNISPDDPIFCHTLLTNFFESGGSPFEKGGICLVYPDWYKRGSNVEMTSKESFDVCLNQPRESMGNCTEHAYMQMGALKVAAETEPLFENCPVDYMVTEDHAYTARDGVSYDVVNIGKIGWSTKANPVGSYYNNLKYKDAILEYKKIASLIAPDLYPDPAVKEYVANGDYDKALDSFDKLVSAHPKRIVIFRNIIYFESKLPEKEAEKFAFMVLRRWPDNPYSLLAVINLKHYAENMPYFAKRLKEELPSSGYAEFVLGSLYEENSNFDHALGWYDKSLKINPQNPYSLKAKAYRFYDQGRYEEAKELINKAIEIAPNIPGNHLLLANIQMMKGDFQAALKESGKEERVFSNNPNAYFLNASITLSMGMARKAGDMAERYLQDMFKKHPDFQSLKALHPQIADALNIKFNSCYNMGDYNCMLVSAAGILSLVDNLWELKNSTMVKLSLVEYDPDAALSFAGRMDQNSIDTKILKFNAYCMKNDLDSASAVLEELEIAALGLPFVWQIKGILEYQKGDLERAAELFEEAASKNEYDWTSRVYLAEMHHFFAGGKRARANELDKDLFSRFPDVSAVRVIHAAMLYDSGSTGEAVEIALENLNANPFDLSAAFLLARAALDGNFESLRSPPEDVAIELGERLSRLMPHDWTGAYILARAYSKLGRYEEALQYAEVAKERWMKNPLKPVNFLDVENLPDIVRKEAEEAKCHSRESGNPL